MVLWYVVFDLNIINGLLNSGWGREWEGRISLRGRPGRICGNRQSWRLRFLSRCACDIWGKTCWRLIRSCWRCLKCLTKGPNPNRYMCSIHDGMTKLHIPKLCWNGTHPRSTKDRNWTLSMISRRQRS